MPLVPQMRLLQTSLARAVGAHTSVGPIAGRLTRTLRVVDTTEGSDRPGVQAPVRLVAAPCRLDNLEGKKLSSLW